MLPDLGAGGAQKVLMRLADGIDRERWEPRLFVMGGVQVLTPPATLATEIGSYHRAIAGVPWLVRRLRAFAPDVVLSTLAYTNFVLLAASKTLPNQTRVLVREANTPQATLNALSPLLSRLAPYRRLYPRATRVLVQTPQIRDALEDLVPGLGSKIRLLPNPVDVDVLRMARPERISGPGLRLVAAGRLTRQKGFDRMINMVNELPTKTMLTIFGEGPERVALEAQARMLGVAGRVQLPGYVNNLQAHLAGADAFVITSRWEGLPNVVLEALALGVPVVATPDAGLNGIALEAIGAIRIAPPGENFIELLRGIEVCDPTVLGSRKSSLPVAYHADAVIKNLEAIFEEALM